MKNIEKLTPEQMRTMLRNISDILNRHYPTLSSNDQDALHLELIGLEFFNDESSKIPLVN